MDALPVLSQVKSFVQAIFGQTDQARQTQINFSRQCPVVSQVRSAVEIFYGDREAAVETQKECGNFILRAVDGVPVVGHVKGAVHYALRDKAGGDMAMKAATHTTAVIVGGAGGFLAAGPPGAIAAGAASGAAFDTIITGIDSTISGKVKPYGFTEPFADPRNAGKWVDAVGGMAIDGVTGHATGAVVKSVQTKIAGGTGMTASAVVASAGEEGLHSSVAILKQVCAKVESVAITLRCGNIYLFKNKKLAKISKCILANLLETFSNFAGECSSLTIRVKNGIAELVPYSIKVCIETDSVYVLNGDGSMRELLDGEFYTQNSSKNTVIIEDKERCHEFCEELKRNMESNSDDSRQETSNGDDSKTAPKGGVDFIGTVQSSVPSEEGSNMIWEYEEYTETPNGFVAMKAKNVNPN